MYQNAGSVQGRRFTFLPYLVDLQPVWQEHVPGQKIRARMGTVRDNGWQMKLKLVVATDRHFAWMLGEGAAPRGLSLPPGGVDSDDTLRMLRGLALSLRRRACKASWLVVVDGVVIGLTSLLHAPDADGQAIFGYGVAPTCRGRGYGRAMVAAVVRRVRAWPSLRTLCAETRIDNLASQHILAQNGFVRLGSRIDPDDGLVAVWQRDLRRWYLPHPLHLAHRVRRLCRGAPVG